MATKPDIADLLEWFELNETSGNRTGSHNSYVLTDNGTVDYATGKQGNCADFDIAIPEYFTRAVPNTGLNIGANSFTIVYWFNARSVIEKTSYNTVWKNSYTQSTGGVDTKLALNVGATYFQVAFQLYGSASGSGIITVHSAGATLHKVDDLDKWWFIACVHDQAGEITHIYSDTTGSLQLDESNDYSASGIVPGSPSQGLGVGANDGGGNPFDGLVDELSIWNTNLSLDEIAWLYNAGVGRSFADLEIEVFGGNSGRQVIGCQVYEDATRENMLADWTFRVSDLAPELDEHGFGYLPLFVPLDRDSAFRFYDALPTAHIRLTDGLFTLYEGRIEDRRIVAGGLEVGAFGYWRALFDVPYTALWSTRRSRNFALVTEQDIATWTPSKYYTEIHPRSDLFISLRKGESYTRDADIGGFFFRLPHLGSRSVAKIAFSYDLTLPTGWRFDTQTAEDDFSSPASEDTITGDGTNKTGSKSLTSLTANREMVIFSIYNDTAADPYTNSGETDDWYVLIYGLRIQTTTSSAVYADEVVDDLVAHVNGENSGQLNASTALVQSPAVDLKEASYEDVWPGDIAIELANLGDSSTPPGRYEVGVWEGQKLFFRPRGDNALEWFTDAVDIQVDSTLDTMYNSVYAVYTNKLGQKRRTADSDDTASQGRYGVIRRAALNARTDDSTEAGVYRDAQLEDTKDITPRAQVTATGLFTSAGARAPLYVPRPGDQLTLRNLPLSSGGVVDKIRTFRISRVTPDISNGRLTVVPEGDLPTLEILVAQNEIRRRN